MQFWIDNSFQTQWPERSADALLTQWMKLQGKIYSAHPTHHTLRFDHAGTAYFAKVHFGTGWKEIFKNLICLRLPTISAETEWNALRLLDQLNIPTLKPLAFVQKGKNPARIRSCLITAELTNVISLEKLCETWINNPPSPILKRTLINKLANTVRTMHQNGLNHRDCYLCHFLLDQTLSLPQHKNDPVRLYVIDLHRAQIRAKTPMRWLVKDVGGLWFSAMNLPLTSRDLLRFMRVYSGVSLRETLTRDKKFWRQVKRRAIRLYQKIYGRIPNVD